MVVINCYMLVVMYSAHSLLYVSELSLLLTFSVSCEFVDFELSSYCIC